ncbi:MAG TPA: cupredoxin family copper-binding protein [Lichenihabitans sp.]|jgi:plastocyanin|nr:cupredoxin family copper-binding protein [Lichenihabitans sp.]
MTNKSNCRRLAAGTVALGLLIGALAKPAGVRADDPPTVRIDNFSFVPAELKVKVGTKVTWENMDDIPHSIVLTDKSFRSKPLDTHDTASFTFAKAGVVDYFCGLHPHMHATITVVP